MLSVTPDAAGPALVVALGIMAAFLAAIIVLAEAIVLWRLHWASFWRSVGYSFVANLVSGAVGIIFLIYQPPTFTLLLLLGFIVSVLVEGGVLMLLKRNATRESWRAALVMNVVSYALIALSLLLLNQG